MYVTNRINSLIREKKGIVLNHIDPFQLSQGTWVEVVMLKKKRVFVIKFLSSKFELFIMA
jgi:hypothetical protein